MPNFYPVGENEWLDIARVKPVIKKERAQYVIVSLTTQLFHMHD